MALPGRDDTTASWQRGIDRLDAICPPRPRRAYDMSMEVEPPLDEVDREPDSFTAAWRRSSPHAPTARSQQDRETGFGPTGAYWGDECA